VNNIILIFTCLGIGVLLRNLRSFPKGAHLPLNQVILYVPLPALALLNIPFVEWSLGLISLCLMPWLAFALAFVFFTTLGKKRGWSSSLVGCLILTAGFSNTSFVGFPIIEAIFGKEGLPYAILIDQPGTFLLCSTLGVYLASHFSSGKMPIRALLGKVITFPFFIAFFLALILSLFGWRPEGHLKDILERLSSLLTPLALIAVGLQLGWSDVWVERKNLMIGLGYKLLLSPFIIFLVYRLIPLPTKVYDITVMESAMAPMITSSLLAATHGLEPRLAGMMVGVGIPLSFLTLGFWYFVL
jgi:malate permease and related proteins